jgi:hypothetical protein
MEFEFKEPSEWISRLSHSDDTRVYMQRVRSIRNRVPGKLFFFQGSSASEVDSKAKVDNSCICGLQFLPRPHITSVLMQLKSLYIPRCLGRKGSYCPHESLQLLKVAHNASRFSHNSPLPTSETLAGAICIIPNTLMLPQLVISRPCVELLIRLGVVVLRPVRIPAEDFVVVSMTLQRP